MNHAYGSRLPIFFYTYAPDKFDLDAAMLQLVPALLPNRDLHFAGVSFAGHETTSDRHV